MNKILRPFENVIVTNAMDEDSMTNKNTLTDLTAELMSSMCNGVVFGQDAILSTSDLLDIQVVKVLLSTDTSTAVDLGCGAQCEEPSGQLIFGSTLEEMYTSYQCEEEICTGDFQCL